MVDQFWNFHLQKDILLNLFTLIWLTASTTKTTKENLRIVLFNNTPTR